MSDREERLVEALREGPRPSPPDGLKQAIKDEIPATISSGGSSSTSRGQVWLIAAALLLMFGGGWLAFSLISSHSPVRSTVADHAPSTAVEDLSLQAPAPPGKAESSTDAEPSADFDLKETGTAIAEVRPLDQERIADQYPAEAAAPMSAPPPPTVVSPAPAAERVEKPPGDLAEEPTVQRRRETRQLAEMDSKRETYATAGQADDRSSMKSRAANADAIESATLTEELALTGTSSRMAVDDRRETALSYGQISASIAGGELPDPDSIDVQALIDHFDYGDRPPWRRENLSLFVEGGAAPFRHDGWRTIRIGIRGGKAMETSEDARLGVWFNPAAVARYRRVGEAAVREPRTDAALEFDLDELSSDYASSWLFEIRLLPDIDPDELVARANLRYIAPSGEQKEIERNLRGGHITSTWSTTSSALKTAIVVGRWAESMKGEPSMEESTELLQRARDLESSPLTDESVDELVRLIGRTVKLMTRR